MSKPTCCNFEAKWVENVPGKGYWFCSECKKEVIPETQIEQWWDEWKAEQEAKKSTSYFIYNPQTQGFDPYEIK